MKYSGDPKTGHVRFLNGQKLIRHQMVQFSNGMTFWLPFCPIPFENRTFPFLILDKMAVKMSGFQVLLLNKNVLFLNGRISDPHCTSHVFNTGLNGFYLVKFDNVWMPEKFQVLDFSSDLAHHIQALDFLTVQDFYCNLVLGDLVKSD